MLSAVAAMAITSVSAEQHLNLASSVTQPPSCPRRRAASPVAMSTLDQADRQRGPCHIFTELLMKADQ